MQFLEDQGKVRAQLISDHGPRKALPTLPEGCFVLRHPQHLGQSNATFPAASTSQSCVQQRAVDTCAPRIRHGSNAGNGIASKSHSSTKDRLAWVSGLQAQCYTHLTVTCLLPTAGNWIPAATCTPAVIYSHPTSTHWPTCSTRKPNLPAHGSLATSLSPLYAHLCQCAIILPKRLLSVSSPTAPQHSHLPHFTRYNR